MLNPTADQEAILAHLEDLLTQPIEETVDDVQLMPRSANGKILPFFEIEFGALTPTPRGRTFAGEDAQTHDTYFFMTAYGPSKKVVRQMSNRLYDQGVLVGWSPSINAAGLYAGGSTPFSIYDEVRPTIYALRCTFRFNVNNAA